MKLRFFALLIGLFVVSAASGQEYQSAVGLRLGFPVSASYKTFVNDNAAVEVYAGFRGYGSYSWVNIAGAYQVHNPINDVDGLQWYYGGGVGVFFWNYDFDTNFSSTSFGLQGYLGLDYKFENTPISITADWVPTIFLGGDLNVGTFGAGFGSLGVRYVIAE